MYRCVDVLNIPTCCESRLMKLIPHNHMSWSSCGALAHYGHCGWLHFPSPEMSPSNMWKDDDGEFIRIFTLKSPLNTNLLKYLPKALHDLNPLSHRKLLKSFYFGINSTTKYQRVCSTTQKGVFHDATWKKTSRPIIEDRESWRGSVSGRRASRSSRSVLIKTWLLSKSYRKPRSIEKCFVPYKLGVFPTCEVKIAGKGIWW